MRGWEKRTVPIVPVLRKHPWYSADHGAHTDTLHTDPERASYATGDRGKMH